MSRLAAKLCACLSLLGLLVLLSCDRGPAQNPSSLWLSYSQSEINLVLVDHAPPAF
jgi:hypothetical protein